MSQVELPDLQPEHKHTLILEIPSINEPSSAPVSLASSPLDTRQSSDDSGVPTPTTTTETTHSEPTALPLTTNAIASSSSLTTLTVKFAPLPELLPRKRRSTIPLGMAARGQLIRHRPGYRDRSAWKDEGSGERRRRQEELAARHARFSAYAAYAAAREEEKEEGEEDEEDDDWPRQRRHDVDDPLLVIGRMVKVAGKTLWKRVSNKDVAAAAAAVTASTTEGSDRQEDTGRPRSLSITQTSRISPPTLRPILGNITTNVVDHPIDTHEEEGEEEEEGRVWEEEVGDSFPRNVSQTETIVEGRAVYSRLTTKVDVLSRFPPPSPTLLASSKRISHFMRPTNTKKLSASKAIRLADGRS